MSKYADLRQLLLENERCYVDEIHRLDHDPKVLLLPENAIDQGGGWLYLPAEAGSGDWNIARMLGQGNVAFKALSLLPDAETHLLVPPKFADLFADAHAAQSSLVYFEGCAAPAHERQSAQIDLSSLHPGLQLQSRRAGADFAFYLLLEGQIQGYIKAIHLAPNHVEVYIEVQPAMRQRGFGEYLLFEALKEAANTHRCLVYTVDAENVASLSLARKAGLQQFMELSRFLRPYSGLSAPL
jgi:ribosomal protein S18 acetylase RimI-like enzyme